MRRTAVVVLVPLLLAGCNASKPGQTAEKANGSAESSSSSALERLAAEAQREETQTTEKLRLDLEPPQVLVKADARVQPVTGEAQVKASLPLDEVLKQTEAPEYLKQSNKPRPADVAEREISPAAVRAYVRGRTAYLENNRFESVNQLEQARRLDPKSAEILRLLGVVYFDRGDDVRGAQRLIEAVKLEPDDSPSLFLLGRYAYQKGRWSEAIATLSRAANDDPMVVDPAIPYLRPYYLGQAMLASGYDAAAVAKLQEYLAMPARFSRTSRLHLELAFLDRQRGEVNVQVGDALARLGRFEQAIEHYREAAGDENVDKELLSARLIYAHLAMNRPATAQRLLIEQLQQSQSSQRLLTLAPYVAEATGDARFAQVLQQVYQQSRKPPLLALAIAESMPREEAVKFLSGHLQAKPDDLLVFDRLVSQYAAGDHATIVTSVLKMIAAKPAMAREYTDHLLSQKPRVQELLAALDQLDEAQRQAAPAMFLRGAMYEAMGQVKEAVAAYEQALTADENFVSPPLATVELQLRLQRYEQALELLDKVKDKQEPGARFARARALAGLNRLDEASQLIDQLLVEKPREVRYRLFRARVQTLQRDFIGAERALASILDFDPANEEAYTALFQLYENNPRTDHLQWLRLMREVQREIPGSRIARVKMAEWQAANRQFPQAEQNLRSVLADFPADDEALKHLVEVLGRSDRWVEAETLLVQQVEKRPDDPMPLLLLREVAKRLDHMEQYYPRHEAFLLRQPKSVEVWAELAQLYDQSSQPEKAIAALQEVVKLRPESRKDVRLMLVRLYHRAGRVDQSLKLVDEAIAEETDAARAADLHYFRAMIHHEQQDMAAHEAALLKALESDADHAPSNNDLGYLWADQNRNLDKAQRMTLKAVGAEPNNGAYLDSLGWVYYKLGQFQDAVRRLEEARSKPQGEDPVILDHLGDALWRMERNAQAINYWREALRIAEGLTPDKRPDVQKVRQVLTEKIRAAEAGEAPKVAPLPAELPSPQIKAEAPAPAP